MEIPKIPDGEYRFADLVWESEPINSTALIKTAQERLGWKKATSYTVLRKLCEKGILKNENATVTAIVKKEMCIRDRIKRKHCLLQPGRVYAKFQVKPGSMITGYLPRCLRRCV